jgi:hypothetical protein
MNDVLFVMRFTLHTWRFLLVSEDVRSQKSGDNWKSLMIYLCPSLIVIALRKLL